MKKARILIVEDEGIVAVNTKTALLSFGYDVLPIAISAKTALELAQRERPDLVLMDIKLRGPQDGIDAATIIWEEYGIPSVFVSAYGTEETMERVGRIAHFGFLEKPVEEWQLEPAIEEALKKHRSGLMKG